MLQGIVNGYNKGEVSCNQAVYELVEVLRMCYGDGKIRVNGKGAKTFTVGIENGSMYSINTKGMDRSKLDMLRATIWTNNGKNGELHLGPGCSTKHHTEGIYDLAHPCQGCTKTDTIKYIEWLKRN